MIGIGNIAVIKEEFGVFVGRKGIVKWIDNTRKKNVLMEFKKMSFWIEDYYLEVEK